MKKLVIKSDKPMFYRAIFHIEPNGFNWDIGVYKGFHGSWSGKEYEEAFRQEIKEKLPFGNFSTFEKGGRLTPDRFIHTEDDRQHIYCFPSSIVYVGLEKGLDQLTEKLEKENFSSFSYIYRDNPIALYNMTENEVSATLDANTAVIKDNIKEYVRDYPSSYKYGVVDNVFEFVRFPNTFDEFSYSPNWSSDELAFKKTLDVFDGMVKSNEIVMDDNHNFVVNENTAKKSLKVPVNKVAAEREAELYGR